MKIIMNKQSSSCMHWMASVACSNCRAPRPRTIFVGCSYAKVCWTRCQQPCWTWWPIGVRHPLTWRWRLSRSCWCSLKSRSRIFMYGMRWGRGRLFEVSYHFYLGQFLESLTCWHIRTSSCMRASRARLSCTDAQGCQTLINECNTPGGSAECKCSGGLDPHSGRTVIWSTWHCMRLTALGNE